MGIHVTICSHPNCENEIAGFAAAKEAPNGQRWYCQEHRATPDRPNAPKRT